MLHEEDLHAYGIVYGCNFRDIQDHQRAILYAMEITVR